MASDVEQGDVSGPGERYEDPGSEIGNRVREVGHRLRQAMTGRASSEDAAALEHVVNDETEQLVEGVRDSMTEGVRDLLQEFLAALGPGQMRAFMLGALFASALWILAFVAVVALLAIVPHVRP